MKRLLTAFLTSTLLFTPCVTSAAQPDATSAAVIQLQTATKKGTAFYISENGYLLTNFHVIDGASSVKVCTQEDAQGETVCDQTAEVLAEDRETDVALLKLVSSRKVSRPFLTLGDSDTLSLSDRIRLFGYPDTGGNALTVSVGKVTGWWDKREFVKVDAALSHGSSGGAMLDENGIAVGMTMAILKERDANSGLIIPINRVKDWLTSIGYGGTALLGDSVEALTQSKTAMEERLKKYQTLTRAQISAYNEITTEYDALTDKEKKTYENALDKIEDNERTERQKVDDYLTSIKDAATDEQYVAEEQRVGLLWAEFAAKIEEQKQRLESAYEHNVKVYDQLEAIALEKAGVVNYTARIMELHATLEEVKRKLSRLKLQEAEKKRQDTARPPTSPPPNTDSNSNESDLLRYEDFGSMQPVSLGDWLLRSVNYRRNGADFAFLFWGFGNPLPPGQYGSIAVEITDLTTGETVTPLIVRKKLLLFRFMPGTEYRVVLTANTKSGDDVKSLRFEMTTL